MHRPALHQGFTHCKGIHPYDQNLIMKKEHGTAELLRSHEERSNTQTACDLDSNHLLVKLITYFLLLISYNYMA